MKPLLLTLFVSLAISFTSCKKDQTNNSETAQKIEGKWQIVSLSLNQNFGGEDHITTYTGASTDYIEFTSNGKMNTYLNGKLTVNNYSVISDKKISIDTDDANIRELTDTTLILSSRDGTGSVGFTEIIYNLKR